MLADLQLAHKCEIACRLALQPVERRHTSCRKPEYINNSTNQAVFSAFLVGRQCMHVYDLGWDRWPETGSVRGKNFYTAPVQHHTFETLTFAYIVQITAVFARWDLEGADNQISGCSMPIVYTAAV